MIDGQPFAGLGQPPFHPDLLQPRIDRPVGEQRGLSRRQARVAELGQPFGRGLGPLLRPAHDCAGPEEQLRTTGDRGGADTSAAFQQRHRRIEFAQGGLDGGQVGEDLIARLGAEVGLGGGPGRHEAGVGQRPHPAQAPLVGVLQPDDGVHGLEGLTLALFGIADQPAAQFGGDQLIHRKDHVANRE